MVDQADHPTRRIVAGSRPWNRRTFARISDLEGAWELVTTPEELAVAVSTAPGPAAIYFLHWSWIVPAAIHDHHECVVFHMTELPYGRGGSPLQNLVARGHRTTTLTALRMTAELDAGPVYATAPLDLAGTAESVYLRADELAAEMIERMLEEPTVPVPQHGEPVVFPRRRPDESEVPPDLPDLDAWVDFVAMLDAEGYPHAYLDHGPFRVSLRRAARYDGRVEVDARIEWREEPG